MMENMNVPDKKRRRQKEVEMLHSETEAIIWTKKIEQASEVKHKKKNKECKESERNHKARFKHAFVFLEPDEDEIEDKEDFFLNEHFLNLQRELDNQVLEFNRKHLMPSLVRIDFRFEKSNAF